MTNYTEASLERAAAKKAAAVAAVSGGTATLEQKRLFAASVRPAHAHAHEWTCFARTMRDMGCEVALVEWANTERRAWVDSDGKTVAWAN